MMDQPAPQSTDTSAPAWQPISAIERRIVGVLVEKAKTTPDNYPLTLNAIRVASNQKSNRDPVMQLEEDHFEQPLDHLRQMGAITEIFSDNRAPKYRHRLYQWLGVDKTELAVMAELLLRGAQSLGELRSRAARMEPIAGQEALRPLLDSLQSKGLIQYLTPKGRGCIVTHALYSENELRRLKAEFAGSAVTEADDPAPPRTAPLPSRLSGTAPDPQRDGAAGLAALRQEVAELKAQLRELREQTAEESAKLREELDDLNRQLGV